MRLGTTIQTNSYLQPVNSPITGGSQPFPTVVPWKWGVQQGLQTKKIRSSTGYFKKLQGGSVSTENLNMATISASLFNGGTVANTSIQNGTFPSGLMTGGTLNNVIMGSPSITNGTCTNGVHNNITLGTPQVVGGTANFGTYQVGGSAGITGSIVYVKTVSPGTTFGTLSFIGGLITLSQ